MNTQASELFAIDFDGTVVTERYDINDPSLHGEEAPLAVMTMKILAENGHRLVLWTLRDGEHLNTAVGWFEQRGIPLFGVNDHSDRWPTKSEKKSPKVPATMYIDDRAFGAIKRKLGEETVLCWSNVTVTLYKLGYITEEQCDKIINSILHN